MTTKYCLVDAFAQEPFSGVPITVFPDSSGISNEDYLKIASEMPTSETVFIHQAGGEYSIRSYNQNGEIGFGAHTTVAALKALYSQTENLDKAIKMNIDGSDISGYVENDAGKESILISKKIEQHVDHFVPNIEDIAKIIGLDSNDIDCHNYTPLIVSSGVPHLFVPLKSYSAVREAYFNRSHWSQSSLTTSLVDKIFLFAPNTDRKGADFHARLLDGYATTHSDPAIGEAVPAFAAFLCQQKKVQRGTHVFTVRRGANNARQSHLHVEMDNFGEELLNIRIGGSAFITSKAELLLQ